ncbi:unnamed protein product [Linum tenue]|uniref:DYW domain-containing protein n=1 Tax=Linum tenue TaxID=586396 RepID=A0AAV0HHM4_9ROSI|nr:unnamed protein product [Linum tenue]
MGLISSAKRVFDNLDWKDSVSWVAMIAGLSKNGNFTSAEQVFSKLKDKDGVSYNSLISGLAQQGFSDRALELFEKMQVEGLDPDCVTVASLLSVCASTKALHRGKQLHSYALKAGMSADSIIEGALLDLYARCGKTQEAYLVFNNMDTKDSISWNGLISGFSQSGHYEEALNVFNQMNKVEVEPNHVTFIGVLTACSHVGLVNEGICYFESMKKEHGLVPKPEHYACVVDLLSRAGLLSRARKFVEEMPIKPDPMVWRTLLSSCIVHKNIELGELAAKNLLDLEPEDSASYVLLSNMYAVSRRWNYRDQTREMMKNRGVRKEPGRSWIEVMNKIHAFFVGDKLHPLADEIYEYLEELNNRAADIGYVQDHNSLLNETEMEQKDPTLYVHSEKLAVTFALLSLPDGIPIRVMKNLRVCSDCHNWIKFISRISNREIVVRDAYRFHHFENGNCSCKDFW